MAILPPEAVRLTADLGRAAEWDPGPASSKQEGRGAPGPGTCFLIVADFRGRQIPMTYMVTGWDPSSSLIFTGTGKSVTALGTITFEDDGVGGTRLAYEPRLAVSAVPRHFRRRVVREPWRGRRRRRHPNLPPGPLGIVPE